MHRLNVECTFPRQLHLPSSIAAAVFESHMSAVVLLVAFKESTLKDSRLKDSKLKDSKPKDSRLKDSI